MVGLAIQLYTEQCIDKTENDLSHLRFGSQEHSFSARIKISLINLRNYLPYPRLFYWLDGEEGQSFLVY